MLENILDKLSFLGVWVSGLIEKIILYLSNLGLKITPFSSKIISLIIFLSLIYLFLKILTATKKLIKWGIITLSIIFAFSILTSFFV